MNAIVQAKLSLDLLEAEVGLALLALEDGHGVEIVRAVLEELDDGLSGVVALAPPGFPGQLVQLVG